MSELERRVEAARGLLEVPVTRADSARALVRLAATQRRRRRRRTVATGLAGVAVGAAAMLALWPAPAPAPEPGRIVALEPDPAPAPEPEPPAPRFVTDAASPERTVVFSDGSLAKLSAPNTELVLETDREDLLELVLARGAARFAVEENPRRTFRVRTPHLRVEVLGTRFSVEQTEAGTEVRVQRGRVAVIRGDDRHELGPGMRLAFDGQRTVIEDARAPARRGRRAPSDARTRRRVRAERGAAAPTPSPGRRAARADARAPSTPPIPTRRRPWERLADDGRYADAYDALERSPQKPESAKDLMLAADVARLSGHPREAAGYLRRVVKHHRGEAQGMLAAFTLGRILQRELGEPREAAEAYHVARSLAPSGSLAEDALAHEAECRAGAGQEEAAAALAEQYLRQYPSGRKAGKMRRLVGRSP